MKYAVTVTTVTPLHIGTGQVLLRDYDFVTGRDQTFVLDQDAIFADVYDRTKQVPERPAGSLVGVGQLRAGSPFVRYRLSGTTAVDEVREQIKDAQGRCYLPGSSLKGGLRTVLLAYAGARRALRKARINYQQTRRGDFVKESAAANMEQAAFRPAQNDPNHDLLRALQVADSEPLPDSESPLQLLHAQVFTGGEPSAPIWVEAIRPDMTFTLQIKVDDDLLNQHGQALGWAERSEWLRQLPAAANLFARNRWGHERQAAASKGLSDAAQLYERLLSTKLDGNQFLLQLGWGAGWGGKTIGDLLTPDMAWEARQKFELGRPPTWRGPWEPQRERAFPTSRRLQVKRGNNADAEPGLPLGWVRVTLQEPA